MPQAFSASNRRLLVAGVGLQREGVQDGFAGAAQSIPSPWIDASAQYPTMFDPTNIDAANHATFLPTHVSTYANTNMIGHHLIYRDIGRSDNFDVGCQWIMDNDERLIGQIMPAALIDPDGAVGEMGLSVTYDISIFNGTIYIQNVFRHDPISVSFDSQYYSTYNSAAQQAPKLHLGGTIYNQGGDGINWLMLRVRNGAMQQYLNGKPLGSPVNLPSWAAGRTKAGIQVISTKVPIGNTGLSGNTVTEIIPDLAANWFWRPLPEWQSFSDVIAWDHSWDIDDAVLYTPSAGEQSQYGIDATPRVASIPDASGSKPLLRDPGPYGQAFLGPSSLPLPGPGIIPYSQRFRRAAVRFDQVNTGPNLFSMLSPQPTIQNSDDYFNSPNGYAPPYWAALLCRLPATPGGAMDSVLGSDPTISAGPTVSYGAQVPVTGSDWSFACWYEPVSTLTPDGVVRSGHTQSANETVLLIISMAEGTNASAMHVAWRDSAGVVQTSSAVGTVSVAAPSMAWRELFFGWISTHSYLSAAGLKVGALSAANISSLVAWADPWLLVPSVESSEP